MGGVVCALDESGMVVRFEGIQNLKVVLKARRELEISLK